MRLLLVAYEFPPVVAAQSLRWYYLINELAKKRHYVDVVTADLADVWQSPLPLEANITVRRAFAGPFMGTVSALLRRNSNRETADRIGARAQASGVIASGYRHVRRWLNAILFPDLRSEWYPFALREIRWFMKRHSYDALITSHEPGVDLMLGLKIKRQYDVPWVADIGDLLGLGSSSESRRRRELELESRVCNNADLVLVTNANAANLLRQRHRISNDKCRLIGQGFSASAHKRAKSPISIKKPACHLVFTGSLYRRMRNPGIFLETAAQIKEVKVTFAGYADFDIASYKRTNPNFAYVPYLTHGESLALQRAADVLINLGNDNTYQVPGKFFEYLGACRPILHISMNPTNDPVAGILNECRRGLTVTNRADEIRNALKLITRMWLASRLDVSFDLSLERVEQYSWQSQASTLEQAILGLSDGPVVTQPA